MLKINDHTFEYLKNESADEAQIVHLKYIAPTLENLDKREHSI